jgi:hypothetical protein
MNMITHCHAYALFPLSTFEHFEAAVTYHIDGHNPAAIEKYKSRGWSMVPQLRGLEWTAKLQRVGDFACWTMALSNPPKIPCTLTLNSWKRLDFKSGDFVFIGDPYTRPELRFSYMVGSPFVRGAMSRYLQIVKKYVMYSSPFDRELTYYLANSTLMLDSSVSWIPSRTFGFNYQKQIKKLYSVIS